MRSGPFLPRRAILIGTLAILLAGCAQTTPTATGPQGPALQATATRAPTLTPRPTFTAAAVATIALPTTAAVQGSPTPASTNAPAPAVRPADGLSLTVLHTNDVYGYIDPCG